MYLPSLFPFFFLFPFPSSLSYIFFPFSEILINVAAPQRGDRVTTSFFLKNSATFYQNISKKTFIHIWWVGGWVYVFAFALSLLLSFFPFPLPSLTSFSF
jgi:hypothetical protein